MLDLTFNKLRKPIFTMRFGGGFTSDGASVARPMCG